MKSFDVAKTALGNTLRSKLRTFLTVIAIVIGAFALTLTFGMGAGINKYVDHVVEGFGQEDEMYVMGSQEAAQEQGADDEGPSEYDADGDSGEMTMMGTSTLDDDDIDAVRDIDGVESVQAIVMIDVDYLEGADGEQWTVNRMGESVDARALEMVAGDPPAQDAMELAVPEAWVSALGGDSPSDVVGDTVQLGFTNLAQEEETVEATISGVSEPSVSQTGQVPTPSRELSEQINEAAMSGLPEEQPSTYIYAVAQVDDMEADETSIKEQLTDDGLTGMTLEDQLGMIQGIINTVTWVLGGFAIIALVAASFGIVNTLLMSVQERTREIGLMKALGMSRGKVFGLFSMEAIVIGLMGSLIGVGAGVGAGVIGNALLVNGPLENVVGLVLFAVDPISIVLITVLVVGIAFLAGTLPAARAAKKDPIDALRYE
ncbi:MAG: FtsX-like permease family protein [Nesterenkonia sp.]|uniref:ABC transporter permease n=1 Tax=Nesterenkonia marinintestina TaxID=2979865 RepID=UPI0021BE7D0C|nr:ABC transporter permease [Nesterenkonia sp. GX14115]MDO5494016.1 FtsX-like permease family protein [Nesterenkonia sp.]